MTRGEYRKTKEGQALWRAFRAIEEAAIQDCKSLEMVGDAWHQVFLRALDPIGRIGLRVRFFANPAALKIWRDGAFGNKDHDAR